MMSSSTFSTMCSHCGQSRKHVGGEEGRGRDLALVEGLVIRRCAGGQRCLRHVGAHQQPPSDDQVTDGEQEPHRRQADFVDLRGLFGRGHQIASQRRRHRLDIFECRAELIGLRLQCRVARVDGVADLRGDMCQRLAAIANDLAEEEVQRLDRGGALVQGVDLGVADVLLDRVVLQEARSAERLQRLGQDLVGAFRTHALDDRQQKVVDAVRHHGSAPEVCCATSSFWCAAAYM